MLSASRSLQYSVHSSHDQFRVAACTFRGAATAPALASSLPTRLVEQIALPAYQFLLALRKEFNYSIDLKLRQPVWLLSHLLS
jgi:hypothetical protein